MEDNWLKYLDILSRVMAPVVGFLCTILAIVVKRLLDELKKMQANHEDLRKDHEKLKAETDKSLIERTYLVAQNNTEHKMIEARIDKQESTTSGLDSKLDKIGLQLALLQQTVDQNKK